MGRPGPFPGGGPQLRPPAPEDPQRSRDPGRPRQQAGQGLLPDFPRRLSSACRPGRQMLLIFLRPASYLCRMDKVETTNARPDIDAEGRAAEWGQAMAGQG